MLGGGEQSFLDLISHLHETWNILAVVPGEGELAIRLRQNGIKTEAVDLPAIRPWHIVNILSSLKSFFDLFRRYRTTLLCHPSIGINKLYGCYGVGKAA